MTMDIEDLVEQAMAEWKEETDYGNNDPAFQGDVGEAIDELVNSLDAGNVKGLMTAKFIVATSD